MSVGTSFHFATVHWLIRPCTRKMELCCPMAAPPDRFCFRGCPTTKVDSLGPDDDGKPFPPNPCSVKAHRVLVLWWASPKAPTSEVLCSDRVVCNAICVCGHIGVCNHIGLLCLLALIGLLVCTWHMVSSLEFAESNLAVHKSVGGGNALLGMERSIADLAA